MKSERTIKRVFKSRLTVEGAGVRLMRALGPGETRLADPFLLLDDFHSENPQDYIAGFPWHPHRGIETVTYMIRGTIEHGDSIGNSGVIGSGDVQWMTAGSGILHQEMPREYDGMMQGFQLWVNLPASKKMTKPRYRDIRSRRIPAYSLPGGGRVKVVAGKIDGIEGPVDDLVIDVEYLDVALDEGSELIHPVDASHTAIAYVFEGGGYFSRNSRDFVSSEHVVLFDVGEGILAKAGKEGMRFLLVSGRPLREPIAWGGPIVMNTQRELDRAFEELRSGTFIGKA